MIFIASAVAQNGGGGGKEKPLLKWRCNVIVIEHGYQYKLKINLIILARAIKSAPRAYTDFNGEP
jgi:hypothetical protein